MNTIYQNVCRYAMDYISNTIVVISRVIIILISILSFSCKVKPTETAPLETKITGRVIDKDVNSFISNVQITTIPSTSSVTTDATGGYVISDVKPGQYVVTASKSGYKSNSINVTVAEGKTASADIQIETLKPDLSISISTIDFNTSQTFSSFYINNGTSIGTINYSITKNADWLTISPTSGTITTGNATISVNVTRTGLSIGNYTAIITVNTNVGTKDVYVTMTIPNPNAPQLTVSPLLLDYGSSLSQLMFTIRNSGTGKIDWTAGSLQSWISVVPSNDSTRIEIDEIKVNVNRTDLPPANYTGEVTINSNAGIQTVTVKMSVQSVPILNVSTTSLDYDSTKTQLSFGVSNAGSGTLSWNVGANQSWMTVLPASGTNSGTVNVSISRNGLTAGNYTGQISVTSNSGTQTINVSMKVVAIPILNVSTTSLDYDSTKTQLSFGVSNAGSGTLSWNVGANQSWMTVLPASGTNSGTVNVSISRNGLTAGNYTGQISVTSNSGTQTINVSMKVRNQSIQSSITVISPNGGETFHTGTTTGNVYTITWSSTGYTGKVRIDLLKGGQQYTSLYYSYDNTDLPPYYVPVRNLVFASGTSKLKLIKCFWCRWSVT